MNVKELVRMLKSYDEELEVAVQVWDYEYDDEEPYEVGSAIIEDVNEWCRRVTINVGLNK